MLHAKENRLKTPQMAKTPQMVKTSQILKISQMMEKFQMVRLSYVLIFPPLSNVG